LPPSQIFTEHNLTHAKFLINFYNGVFFGSVELLTARCRQDIKLESGVLFVGRYPGVTD